MPPSVLRLLIAATLAALAVAPALLPSPAPLFPTASTDVVFVGRVTDAASGGPLAGATVELLPRVGRAATDRNGEYAFSVPAERLRGDRVTLRAIKLGYEIAEKRIRVSGDTARADFTLRAEVLSLEGIVATGAGEEAQRARTEAAAKSYQDTAAPMAAAPANLAVRQGHLPPDWNTEAYDRIYDNRFLAVSSNPLSTFAIDVDRASYSNVRRFITQGQLPPEDAVRIEELINYFPYDYREPRGEHPFAVTTEVAAAPWQPLHRLVRIGLQAERIDTRDLPPSNLVFLLDVSGSMQSPDKLPLLKSSLRLLVDELRSEDRVALVVYAGAAGLVLPPTSGREKATILDAIERLEAGGTAGGAGIRLAYDVAQRNFRRGGNNRVILATDGDFNIGASSDGEMTRLIEEKREGGVFLTVLGFGTGNLKDAKMEALADHGNGNYAYIDGLMEAKKTLVHELGGTLLTVAKDVKLQLEFNPARVQAYRLIGYENRLLRDEDFNDDRKDAGEMGAGHSVTALYEIIPVGVRSPVQVGGVDPLRYRRPGDTSHDTAGDELLYVKLRYKRPDGKRSMLFSQAVRDRGARPSVDFAFATAVAEFGMLLRDSEFKGSSSLEHVVETARRSRGDDPQGYRAEFVRLAEAVRGMGLPKDRVARGR